MNLRVDKPRGLILATWPMPREVHPRMLVAPELLLSQSHHGPTFETEAHGSLSSLRAPVQGHRGGLRERRSESVLEVIHGLSLMTRAVARVGARGG